MRKFEKVSEKVSMFLIAVSAVLFAVLVLSQLCLKSAVTRDKLTGIEKFEKITYASSGVIKKGTITVRLTSGKPSENIEILFNGEKVAVLDGRSRRIDVECDGVVEVSNASGGKISVCVGETDGAELVMNNKPEIASGIKVLCIVKINGVSQ